MNLRSGLRLLQCLLFIGGLNACETTPQRLGGLPPQFIEKGGDPAGKEVKSPELFVRDQPKMLQKDTRRVEDGSLFDLNDSRNYLISSETPYFPGRFLDIKTRIRNPKSPQGESESADKEEALPAEEDGTKAAEGIEEEDLKEILAGLPDMSEEQKQNLKLLDSISFRIDAVLPNGDLMVRTERRSENERTREFNQIEIAARVPVERLMRTKPLTTDDLKEVQFDQKGLEDEIERYSVEWQDEYLVRLSGYSEVKSEAAKQLEDKRRILTKSRGQIEQKLRDIGTERRKLASEREALLKAQAASREKIGKLESDMKAKDAELEELRPKEEVDSEDADTSSGKPAAKPAAGAAAKKPPAAAEKE